MQAEPGEVEVSRVEEKRFVEDQGGGRGRPEQRVEDAPEALPALLLVG